MIEPKIPDHPVATMWSDEEIKAIQAYGKSCAEFAICATSKAISCVICGSDEPRTGSCGSSDSRALCNILGDGKGVAVRCADCNDTGIYEDAHTSFPCQNEAHEVAAEPPAPETVDVSPNCRMQGGICSCTSGGSFGGCRIERGFPEQKALHSIDPKETAEQALRVALRALLYNPAPGPMRSASQFDRAYKAHCDARKMAERALNRFP